MHETGLLLRVLFSIVLDSKVPVCVCLNCNSSLVLKSFRCILIKNKGRICPTIFGLFFKDVVLTCPLGGLLLVVLAQVYLGYTVAVGRPKQATSVAVLLPATVRDPDNGPGYTPLFKYYCWFRRQQQLNQLWRSHLFFGLIFPFFFLSLSLIHFRFLQQTVEEKNNPAMKF